MRLSVLFWEILLAQPQHSVFPHPLRHIRLANGWGLHREVIVLATLSSSLPKYSHEYITGKVYSDFYKKPINPDHHVLSSSCS